jgi:hypothetical protein
MTRTWVFEWHAQFRTDSKRRDRWRAKSRTCSSFSFTSRRLFTENSFWQAKQSIPHTTVMFYGDCLKICKFELWRWKKQRIVSHFLFHQAIVDKKQHDFGLPPTLLSWLSLLWLSLLLTILTILVIKPELQAMLNTLKDYDFQDAFNKLQNRWERCICVEGDYFEGDCV